MRACAACERAPRCRRVEASSTTMTRSTKAGIVSSTRSDELLLVVGGHDDDDRAALEHEPGIVYSVHEGRSPCRGVPRRRVRPRAWSCCPRSRSGCARRATSPSGPSFRWQGWIGAGAGLVRVRGVTAYFDRRRRDHHRRPAAGPSTPTRSTTTSRPASGGALAAATAALFFHHVSRHYVGPRRRSRRWTGTSSAGGTSGALRRAAAGRGRRRRSATPRRLARRLRVGSDRRDRRGARRASAPRRFFARAIVAW